MEPAPLLRIIKMSKTEWHYLTLGTFGAALQGSFPFVFAFLLGEIFGVSRDRQTDGLIDHGFIDRSIG